MNQQQVVVITGASAGIARATARLYGARGDKVGLLARGRAGLDGAAQDVVDAGGQALAVPTDVADYDQVVAAADQVEAALGPIDVWINVAFTSVFAPFTQIEPAEFRRVTEVSYLGFVHGTRVALDRMTPRDSGTIVQVGSALSERAIPLQSAYCGAKHAINGFTESVRTELLHDKSAVHITVVQMPAVNTPQFGWVLSRLPNRSQPVPPIFQPEVPAAAVVHMADHPRRQIWVAWPTVRAILANKVAPGVLDLYLGWRGVAGQQTAEPADPDRPANLWEPVPGDHGAHGSFDQRATDHSAMLWLSLHRPTLGAARDALARRIPSRRWALASRAASSPVAGRGCTGRRAWSRTRRHRPRSDVKRWLS